MIKRIKRMISNFTALFLYPEINRQLKKKRDLYFFCHAWSFGGAERVHIDILNLFKAQNPICFITDRSKNEGFRKEFEAAADVINLGRWTEKKSYKNHLLKKIAKTVNSQKTPTVFGNNSLFMYELTPFLASHVKVVDLTHNFSDFKEGAEWYSLPYVPRLGKRIVVGNHLIDQFSTLYQANNIPQHYLDKIIVIKNKIVANDSLPEKNYDVKLQILFVARNSPEKRVSVLLKTAELCVQMKLPVEFKMIGNYDDLKTSIPSNTSIIGAIYDKNTLKNHYKIAHLLVLTSYREGLPLVIFEAMSFGAVPISTNVGDLSNYISTERHNGILIDNLEDEDQQAEAFAKEILSFHNNRNKLEEFSSNAFETIKIRFNEAEFSTAYKNAVLGEGNF